MQPWNGFRKPIPMKFKTPADLSYCSPLGNLEAGGDGRTLNVLPPSARIPNLATDGATERPSMKNNISPHSHCPRTTMRQLQTSVGSMLMLSVALFSTKSLATTSNSVNVPITGNSVTYALLANPYNHGGNTVKEIFSSTALPAGTTVHKFKVDGTYAESLLTTTWSVPTLLIEPGEGFFLSFPSQAARNLGSATLQVNFSGDLSSATKLPSGGLFAMVGSPIDKSGLLVQDLGYPVSEGDTVYKFDVNHQAYDSETFSEGQWSSGNEPTLGFGNGFFLSRQQVPNLPAQWNGAAPVIPTTPGQFVSAMSFGGAGGDGSQALGFDSAGDLFVGGVSAGRPYLAKSSPTGAELWKLGFAGVGSGTIQALAVDATGNVFVTGNFYGALDFGGGLLTSAGGYDIFVAKYSPSGAHLWSKRFGSGNVVTWVTESGLGMVLDANSDVVVTGIFDGNLDFGGGTLTTTGEDLFLVKFSANGTHLWSRSLKTKGTTGSAIAIDARGNIFMTGSFCLNADFGGGQISSTGVCDMFVAKYSAGGAYVWAKHFGDATTFTSLTIGTALGVDNSGDVFVTGSFQNSTSFGGPTITNAGAADIFIAKYGGADGAPLWSKGFGGRYAETANALIVDHAGDVTLTGRMGLGLNFGNGALPVVPGVMNAYVANLASDGKIRWAKSFGLGWGEPTGMAVNPAGLLFVTGRFTAADFGGGSMRSVGNSDIFIAEFAP